MRSHKIMFYNMMIKNRLRAMDFSRTQLGRMCWVLINPRADQIESTFMYILYTILIKKCGHIRGWPYHWGRPKFYDLRALMTNIPYMYIALTFLEQPFSLIINQNVNIVSIIEKTTSNFPSVQMYIKQF